MKTGNIRQRAAIKVQGSLVSIARVGSAVFLHTTAQIYVTHIDWIPIVDDVAIARIRELYAIGDLSTYEIAAQFDVSPQLVGECVRGVRRFKHLPAIPPPADRCGRRSQEHAR